MLSSLILLVEGATFENDMAVFLKTGGQEFCDINLIMQGHIIPAHKSILSARCMYFQALFRSFMPADNCVHVNYANYHYYILFLICILIID